MPQEQTDRQLVLHAARRRGWEVEEDGPNRLLCRKGKRRLSVNFHAGRAGDIISAFEGTRAIKGRMPGAVIAELNRQ